jgi:tetratricopeptide (TPR) repeat protein
VVAAALVIAAGTLAYLPSFSVPFVFDDFGWIVEEPRVHMRRLGWTQVLHAIHGFPLERWLTRLSFALNYLAGGLEPVGYHAVNLAFHLAAAVTAGLLAREVLARALPDRAPDARDRVAVVTALLFVLHPVQTQAVTYTVQRMTSMGAFFALLSLWLYLGARRADALRPGRRLAGSALAAFAAFSCKENHALVPALAALLELLLVPGLIDRVRRHPRIAMGALAAGGAAVVAALVPYLAYLEVNQARSGVSVGHRLLSQGRVLWHYLSLLAAPLPSRLHVEYAWTSSTSLLQPLTTLPALAGIAALVAAAIVVRRRSVLATLAVSWFLLALSIEQSVLPLDLVFEHRLYLPSFGWLLLAATWLDRLAVLARRARWVVLATPLLLLALGTWQRNVAWQEPARLFADEAGNAPDSSRGLVVASVDLLRRGRLADAEALLTRALDLEPRDQAAMVNLGIVAARRGDQERAESWYRRAIEADPISPTALAVYGDFLFQQARYAEAEATYQKVVAAPASFQANDALVRAHVNLGQVMAMTDRRVPSREHYEAALRLDPDNGRAHYGRAWLELQEGDMSAALADGRRAVELEPENPDFLAQLGEVLAAMGRLEEARGAFRRGLEIDPANERARSGAQRVGERPSRGD